MRAKRRLLRVRCDKLYRRYSCQEDAKLRGKLSPGAELISGLRADSTCGTIRIEDFELIEKLGALGDLALGVWPPHPAVEELAICWFQRPAASSEMPPAANLPREMRCLPERVAQSGSGDWGFGFSFGEFRANATSPGAQPPRRVRLPACWRAR